MKTVLIGIGAHFIHVCYGVYKLEKYLNDKDITVCEYTINQQIDHIYADLLKRQADVYAFSCYIWNVDMCLRLASMLKAVRGDCVIVFGGPEAGAEPIDFLEKNPNVDYCISGQGEKPFGALIQALANNEKYDGIDGLFYKTASGIAGNFQKDDTASVHTPYTEDELKGFSDRIVYYETSRGCPFSCSYCMSAREKLVNYPLDTIKADLLHIAQNNIPLVKLVDRTFNADKNRAYELFSFLSTCGENTRFHFEVSADLFDEKTLEFLKTVKPGKFQFETGIQSTNEKTLKAIGRKADTKKALENIKTILSYKNIHVHVDLIAGLAYEDYESLMRSFNDCMAVRPDMLQLGFLKLLHGTRARETKDEYGYKHKSFAPYEVLENDFITADELILAHTVADAVDKFYNSGAFKNTMAQILDNTKNPFLLFLKLGQGLVTGMPQNALYQLVYDEFGEDIRKNLCIDYLVSGGKNLPAWAKRKEISAFGPKCFEFIKKYKDTLFSDYNDLAVTKIAKIIRIEPIEGSVLLFDREKKIVKDVTTLWEAL